MSMHAWDNEDFVQTVGHWSRDADCGGVLTSVCVRFSSLDARVAGFKLCAVIDASGDPSENGVANNAGPFVRATTNAALSEVHW